MACGRCRKTARAGTTTATGKTITGYLVTYPPILGRPAQTFLSKLEAEAARRAAGGGSITTQYA